MVTITTLMIKELREMTGAGIMASKKALEESRGDIQAAAAALAVQGLATAAKKAGRDTTEGVVQSYVHNGSRVAAMVELNCETDFVARTPEFKALAYDLAMQVAAMSPAYVDTDSIPAGTKDIEDDKLLIEQSFIKEPDKTVGDLITEMVSKVGENVRVRRFSRFALGEEDNGAG